MFFRLFTAALVLISTGCSRVPPAEPAAPAPLAVYTDIIFPAPPWIPVDGRPTQRVVMGPLRHLDVRFTGGTAADLTAFSTAQVPHGWTITATSAEEVTLVKQQERLRLRRETDGAITYRLEARP